MEKLRELVAKWRRRKACTKRELQSLAGHLNHACKVIRPGRRFLRGVFGLLSQFHKRDHMIRLNAAFRADLDWWHVFMEWGIANAGCRPSVISSRNLVGWLRGGVGVWCLVGAQLVPGEME